VRSPDIHPPYAHPARLILILSLAPTVGLGIGRFAYALVLPDMRDTLLWSYSAAGFMNTVNAAGYLAGALFASRMIKQFGMVASVRWGTLACVLSLALCAVSGNFYLLTFARLLAGIGAAAGFVGGGTLAATIAQSRPERANFLLSLFYAGPGIGILASGLVAPFVLQGFGPGSWWIVWWAMTLLGVVMTIPVLLAPLHDNVSATATTAAKFAVLPVVIYLAAYFLFGAGYIAYMTFMIAYVRDAGGGAAAQSAFWSLIGLSAFVTPWVWRRALALDRGGLATTIILGVNAVVGGVMDVLRSRERMKDDLRLRGTTFKAADNNPLKFSANVDDAFHNLLVKRNPAYLSAPAAFDDAMSDIRDHQAAILAALRLAFETMLARFDPNRLQEDFDRQIRKGSILGAPAKLRYWDLYRDRYGELVKDADSGFRNLFGEEFTRAYDEQLKRLKALGRANRDK
jgi:MFS family permease